MTSQVWRLLLATGAAFKLSPTSVVLAWVMLCLSLHIVDPDLVLLNELLGLTLDLPHPCGHAWQSLNHC